MIQDKLEAIAAQLRITSVAVDAGQANDLDVAIVLNELANQLDTARLKSGRERLESAVQ